MSIPVAVQVRVTVELKSAVPPVREAENVGAGKEEVEEMRYVKFILTHLATANNNRDQLGWFLGLGF